MKKELCILGIVCQAALWAGWGSPIDVYTDNPSSIPAVGIDADGNAVIGYKWQLPMQPHVGVTELIGGVPMNQISFPVAVTSGNVDSLNIAVNAAGNATLLWSEFDMINGTELMRSTSLMTGMWNAMPVSLTDPAAETIATANPPGVTIDSSNNSIGLWVATTNDMMMPETTVNYALYTSGSWGMETELTMPSTDYIPEAVLSGNPAGHAFALWPNAGPFVLQGAYYNGMSWTLNSNISTDLTMNCGVPVAVSLNTSDNALILWVNNSDGSLESILFDGSSYGMDVPVYTPPSGFNVSAMAVALGADSDGAAIWMVYDGMNSISYLYFASYISGSWGMPVEIDALMGNLAAQTSLNIGLDGDGNAVIVWERMNQDATTQVMASYMAKGATVAPEPTFLSTDSLDGMDPDLAVNDSGQAVACWITNNSIVQAAILGSGPTPASNLSGSQVKNRFATQLDRVNVLRWNASADSSVVKYFIFRDGQYIATVLASAPLTYEDHNRSRHTALYTVTAVNASDAQSDPISISVP